MRRQETVLANNRGENMKIIGIEIFPLSISFKTVIEESFGTVGKREDDVVIRIHTDDRICGLGEGSTLGPFYSGESQETVMGIIAHHLFPKVLEGKDPFNIDLIHQQMNRVVYGNTVAKSAIDIALYDIMGKALNTPVYKLLGGHFTEEIPIRFSVGIDSPEKMAKFSKEAIDAGFKGIKMKVGLSPYEDIERVEAIREVIGPDPIIDVDVNGAYSTKEAIHVINSMSKFAPILVEQPVAREDLEGMALVRKSVGVPIGACESALTLSQILHVIKMEAADFFNYKISRSGGFFRGKQAVYMIEAAGLFAVGSEQLGFGIELAAQAHFAVSTCILKLPGGYGAGILKIAGGFDTINFTGDIVDQTPVIKNGRLHLPQRPGLGVELIEDRLKRYLTPGKEIITIGERS